MHEVEFAVNSPKDGRLTRGNQFVRTCQGFLGLFSLWLEFCMSKEYVVGIDLGTTFSAITYVNDIGEVEILLNHERETTTPSVVLYANGKLAPSFASRRRLGIGNDWSFHIHAGNPSKLTTMESIGDVDKICLAKCKPDECIHALTCLFSCARTYQGRRRASSSRAATRCVSAASRLQSALSRWRSII